MKTFKDYLNEIALVPLAKSTHTVLNQKLWDGDNLRPEVRSALNKIAEEFIEFLNIPRTNVNDIIITGSNCNFSYSDKSDIDLHLVIDLDDPVICSTCTGDFVKDCFLAKKTLWNVTHDITIYGYDVELYPQDVNSPLFATGVYSLRQNKWLIKPEHKNINYDNQSVITKASEISDQIDKLIDSQSDEISSLETLFDKIYKMRSAGLETGGEFSVEALAFKVLRSNGYLEKLRNYRKHLEDKNLSLT